MVLAIRKLFSSTSLPRTRLERSRPAADASREVVERLLARRFDVGVGHRRCSRDPLKIKERQQTSSREKTLLRSDSTLSLLNRAILEKP